MKIFKTFLKVMLLLVIAFVIGYFAYTGVKYD